MRSLKITCLVLCSMFLVTFLNAQNTSELLGKWKSSYTEDGETYSIVYEFREDQGQIKAFTLEIRDQIGDKESISELVIDNIEFSNKKGKGIFHFEYENDQYDIPAQLRLKDTRTLEISYSYWGMSDQEVWTKME